jgi:hypothetical protein
LRPVSDPDPKDLARALIALTEWAQESVPEEEPEHGLTERLREHLGGETDGLPVVSRALQGFQRANFQVAIDAYLDPAERESGLVGLPMMEGYRIGLAELVKGSRQMPWISDEAGPIEYEPIDIGERRIMCVAAGLWLIRDDGRPFAVMLRRSDHGPGHAELGIEIIARERSLAEEFLVEIERLMAEHNPYRGHVLELSGLPYGGAGVEVRRLPAVTREQIVYPDGVLERIERHTKTFSDHVDALRAAGRHLKRGILLHGPPGTGKTLTVMYLSSLMPGHATSLLFELLNQMDGLNEDVDLVFVLTTNRLEVIEPALASRPGRVDLAVGMPLPDEDGRIRLLNLYAEGLRLDLADDRRFIAATAGATPAFIREVLRRAALLAVERGQGTRVDDELLAGAIDELREGADQLTSNLLGARIAPDSG